MDWLILTYRLPGEPSRHRVAAWRELRRAGAVSLQQATWAAPARPEFREALGRVLAIIDAAQGEAIVLRAAPEDEGSGAALESAYTQDREAELIEFIADCDKFDKEIVKEFRLEKFTPAELDEEEQSYERLRRWFRELQARDVFGAPSSQLAERRLKECALALEGFAERVYEEGPT